MSEVRVYDAPSGLAGKWVRESDVKALRDERDRLSAALLNVRVAWNNKNETTSLHVWHERMKAAMADVEAAMTPARGQELEDK